MGRGHEVVEDWGPQARYRDEVWEAPMLAQAAAVRLDAASIAAVVAMLGAAERPVALDKVRLDRQLRELAMDHGEGRIGDEAILAQSRILRKRLAAFDEPRSGHVPAKRAAMWLQALGESLTSADVPEATADLVLAIYERVVVAGPTFIKAPLTPAAHAHGLAALLPEVVWRPRQDSNLRPAA